jgi:hypothetical protein
MTTTNKYNPLLSAFRELTNPEAFRWYLAQAQATATLASTIARYSFTTAQRLLSDSSSIALAPAVAEPEKAIASTIALAVQDDAVAGIENAIAPSEAETVAPTIEPELNDSESDRISIDELRQVIALPQEYAQAEAKAPEADCGEATAADDAADLAWFDAVSLDVEDDTELRPWTGEDDAEDEARG